MLETNMKEGILQVIELPEDSKVLRSFFRLMYLADSGEITLSECMSLVTAADKYMIQGIHDACSEKLLEKLDVDNAVELLMFADTVDMDELRCKALEVIGT